MPSHLRNPPAILGVLVLILCLGTDLAAQSPYAPANAGDSVQQQPQSLIRKFTFKHAKAADVLKILQQLAGPTDHIGLKIAVDERTNSLVFQPEDDRQSRYFEETCTLLDAETPAPGDTGNGLSISIPALGPHPLAFDFSIGIERGESLESLKQRYNELEQQTHQLADKLKQSKSLSELERSELQAAVRKSFEARQALQRAELADLAQRMKSMQQSIDMRDKLADKVVERRVEDLLNPNLKWDSGKVSEHLVAPNQSSSNLAMPLPPSALQPNVSAPSVRGEPPASVIRKRIQGRWIVQTFSVGDKDALPEFAGQVEVVIEGNSMRYLVGKKDFTGPIFLANCKEPESPTLAEDGPLPIDFIHDPNGDPQTSRGIIACDGTTLSICMASDEGRANKDFRPSLFVPGTKVILIKCRRAEPETAKAVSVDQTTWKSAVQQATSKLLLAYRVPQNIDPSEGPKLIALIDIDYQGKQEAGDLKEEIYEWIESNVPVASPGRFTLLSHRFVDLAMMETKLRPNDLASSSPSFLENRRRILEHLKRHDVKLDSLLITSLKHMGDSDKTRQNQFELTLEGFIDPQTSWFERVTLKGKANGPLKEPESNSLRQFGTPQELLAAAEQHGKSGSYEDFVKLFNDGGARDLAGSLLILAVMQTSIEQTFGGLAEVDSDFVAFRKVLQRWLPQSVSADQQEYIGKGLSTMMSSIGGAPPDQTAMKEFVTSMRESVEGIRDHRKFCIEIMQAFEKLTTKPFVYFGNADQKNEWQISSFGDRAIATLIDGSPGMATTITLQQANGSWRIASLFNELVAEAQPIVPSPNATEAEQPNSKMIARRYSVGSFVTDSFFEGKGNYDLKEIYEKYETEIQQSLADLAKTVTATCTQPPKFVQVLSSSRCLLIGHTETGHQEIADFMSDIGISNDRIRLRGLGIEITKDEAKTLGIELSQQVLQQVLSTEQVEKLREFSTNRPSVLENRNDLVSFVAMDETLVSGTQRPLKINGEFPIPLTIAARIAPGSRQIQIRMDMHRLGNADAEYVAPQFQTLSDGQSVLFATLENLYWLATADIVRESTGAVYEDAESAVKARHSSSLPSDHDANVDLAVFDWNDLLRPLPESGTALVMFSHESDKREQMLPIAEKVAEEAAVKLIHLPIDNWRTLFSQETTHFVLMKDRQLIGTKTGLVTEAKLREFVAQAKDWLTPQSTGVSESSLVRVDCYISPGNDNIGSQHGPAIPITLAVVAIDGDEALLFGTEGIAKYLEKGYACVAIVRDEKGDEKQMPLEVVLTGKVPLKKPDALNDDDALVITTPFFKYDKENIELQEAYDVGSAIYRIRGAHGLTAVKLAPFDSTPQKGERVLAGEFNSSRHHGLIHGFQSLFHWQTQQNLSESDWPIYGANLHGAKMFQVLCPTIPAPSSFLFNAHGRLIGKGGLGDLTENDKTYTGLMPYAIHSVLHAGLEAIDHAGLKAALKQTIEESATAKQSAKHLQQ